jgi:hypothetical protein
MEIFSTFPISRIDWGQLISKRARFSRVRQVLFYLLLLLVVSIACITVGVLQPRARFLIAVGASIILYVLSSFIWGSLLWLQIVSFDALLARAGDYRWESGWAQIIIFLPPLLPVVLFNSLLVLVSRRRRKKFSSA